jgi:hypothetical protein
MRGLEDRAEQIVHGRVPVEVSYQSFDVDTIGDVAACVLKLGAGKQLDLKLAGEGLAIPSNATAAILNITLDDDASAQSFLTVWPSGQPRPTTSANNALPGLVASNSIIAKLGNGGISVYNQQGLVNVVIDLVGYLVPLKGAAGAGTTILNGSGSPADALGSDGNYYLDTTGKVLYGPRAGGLWPRPGITLGSSGAIAVEGTPGNPLIALPPTVLSNATQTTVGTFTAPRAASYLLQANVGVQLVNTNPVIGVGVLATAKCHWSNNPALELGQSVTLGLTVGLVTVPGADTGNIALPGALTALAAGQTVTLQCGLDHVLTLGETVNLTGVITAIQVQFAS